MKPRLIGALLPLILAAALAQAQEHPQVYAGGLAGVSTLSADAQSDVTPGGAQVSLYKPENGPALNVVGGVHVHEYVTLQANYIWNRNALTLTSVRAIGSGSSFSEQPRSSSEHAVIGDLLVYFRERSSGVRPYLSVGLGAVRLHTAAGEGGVNTGAAPSASASVVRAVLRVAVGIDLTLGGAWGARYSFSESLSGNPISAQLSPPAHRNLANFQNLVGLVRTF